MFKRVFDEKVNEQLFGALMSALNSFAQELSSGGLTNFELSSIRFTILKGRDKNQEFLFIANSARKIKEKKVQDELKEIANKFFLKYSNVNWDNWNGEIDVFNDFEKNIDIHLEEPIKKFWEGLVQ